MLKVNYRKIAFGEYAPFCAHCGFGIRAVLEVAHLDHNRANNDIDNLAVLCPNCHKMHDISLIPTSVIRQMRGLKNGADWSRRMKDAGAKAAETRRLRARARKAAATRKALQELKAAASGATETPSGSS